MILQRCAYAAGPSMAQSVRPPTGNAGQLTLLLDWSETRWRPLGRISCVMLDIPDPQIWSEHSHRVVPLHPRPGTFTPALHDWPTGIARRL